MTTPGPRVNTTGHSFFSVVTRPVARSRVPRGSDVMAFRPQYGHGPVYGYQGHYGPPPAFTGIPAPRVPQVSNGLRWLARMIDWVLPWLISSPLWFLTANELESEAAEQTYKVADAGFLSLLFGRWGALGETAGAALADYWGTVVLLAVGTMAAQVLFVALYDMVFHIWFGRTPGKAVCALTVVTTVPQGKPRLRLGQAFSRATVVVILPGLAWVTLFGAALELSPLLALLGVTLLVLSLIECLSLRASDQGRTCWHDRRTRTAVIPRSRVAQLQQAKEFNRRAFEQSKSAAQQLWQADPAQNAIQQAQFAARRIRESEMARRTVRQSKNLTRQVRTSTWGQAIEGRIQPLPKNDSESPPASNRPPEDR
ncbi:RDD family protein [Amycolatopsis sp. H20-H5]|uniref:RDD family protein n=1 Tax=Amycolatopsis sp. H20-H5 TaxID=3046309 RepID=UPI002DBF00EB|nr:RDD family protein [Amycolatopsis sp. H20-H5]MEC3980811.1 RDD family protein [Amycolatopsis sp. H20-H5]